jgi:hypothetical protein
MPVSKADYTAIAATKAAALVAEITPLMDAAINAGKTANVVLNIPLTADMVDSVSSELNTLYQATGWTGVSIGITEATNKPNVMTFTIS